MSFYRPSKKSVKISINKNSSYTLQLIDMVELNGRVMKIRSHFTGADFIIAGKKSHVLQPNYLSKIKKMVGRELIEINNWKPSIKV